MTYTYKCKDENCNHTFDIFKGVNEEINVKCEKCNGEVVRIFAPIGNIWKAGGNFGVGK